MSITAKQYLIKSLGAELSREITAHDLEIVENKLNDVLAMFEVETTPEGKTDAGSDDLLDAFLTAKQIQGCSEKTLALYRYRIEQLSAAVDVPMRRITVFHLRKFLMDEKTAAYPIKHWRGCAAFTALSSAGSTARA